MRTGQVRERQKRGGQRLGLLLVVAALCGVLLTGPRTALAHAVLLRSDPAQNARLTVPPKLVDLFFSEALDHKFSTVQVVNTSGVRQDKSNARFTSDPTEMQLDLPVMTPGYYTVSWTTVSAVDGHHLQGTFPITLLNPDGSAPSGAPAPPATSSGNSGTGVQPFDSTLRWLLWLGLLGLTGGFAFALLVLYPAADAVAGEERTAARSFTLRLAGMVVPASAIVVVVINLAALLRQAALNGSLSDATGLLSGSTGTYWILREALALLAGLLALFLARRQGRSQGALTRAALLAGLLLSLGALLTMSLTSHAAAGTGTLWAVTSDFLHLTGVGLWLGSLVQLPVLLTTRRGPQGEGRTRFAGTALRRFSTLAVCAVSLVLLTGTFNALVQIPDWSALVNTEYGVTLLIKIALLAPLLGLGLLNATRIARRFERRALAGDAGADYRTLVRTAVLESLTGAAVIATTAVLVFLIPAKDAVVQAAVQKASTRAATVSSVYKNQAPAGDLTASLTVSPNRVGDNDFRVQLAGPGLDKVQRVQLRFQFTAQQVGQSTVVANPVPGTTDTYDLQAANFSFVGVWGVTVNVLRNGFDDVNGNFNVEVPDITGATTAATLTSQARSSTAFPAHGITEEQLWGALLVAAGVLALLFRGRLPRVLRLPLAPAAGAAGVIMAVGLAVIALGRGSSQASAAVVQNPVPADQRSVDAGKTIFMANCAKCHGTTGHGDGPLAAGLNPRPFDLTVHVGLHPDGVLFDWISNGIPRTQMPAWKGQLSVQDRWDLLNYLRTLSAGSSDATSSAPAAPAAPAGTPSPGSGTPSARTPTPAR